jgi:hypothetical protein
MIQSASQFLITDVVIAGILVVAVVAALCGRRTGPANQVGSGVRGLDPGHITDMNDLGGKSDAREAQYPAKHSSAERAELRHRQT